MSLFSTLGISASGMAAQRLRAEVVAQNIANADTTRTPEGGPYRRREVIFEARHADPTFASALSVEMNSGAVGVGVSEVRTDESEPDRRYLPGHPDADKDGYVATPRSNPAEDMVDMMGAARGYHANVAAISAVRDMIHRSLDLFRS